LAAMVQGMLTAEARTGHGPSVVISRINQALVNRGLDWRFVTLVYGALSADGKFVYCSAGHVAPLVLTNDGIRQLTSTGPILGVFSDAKFDEDTLLLNEGDMVIMFSDGITEAQDHQEELFGEGRLIARMEAHRDQPSGAIVKGILEAAQEFSVGKQQGDDMTVTATRYHRPKTG
jgi:sigma-B regulation protein RsbU (phosphoserine phosphatase)